MANWWDNSTIGDYADGFLRAAQTESFDTNLKSNATLNSQAITTLATNTLTHNPSTTTVYTLVDHNCVSAYYQIVGDRVPAHGVMVKINKFTSARSAQGLMKQYLATMETDIWQRAKKAERPLGQAAVEMEKTIFWVRDDIFVQVMIDIEGMYATLRLVWRQPYIT